MKLRRAIRSRWVWWACATLTLAATALTGCSNNDASDAVTTDPPRTSSATVPPAPIANACEVVTAIEATRLAGVELARETEVVEGPISSCQYRTAEPDDPAAGRVLRQLRVDLFEGSQFFDLDGIGYPKPERRNLALGDRGFVHTSDDPERGITVQFEIAETVYQVNYTERSIFTNEPADASAAIDQLVAILQTRFATWTAD